MSSSQPKELLTPMNQVLTLTEQAFNVLNYAHRHKTIFMPDCPDCQLKKLLKEIQAETEKAIEQSTQ